MQQTSAEAALLARSARIDGFRAIISDVMSLIERVQASRALVETVIAKEAFGADDVADNVAILDDLSPRYAIADAALNTCNAQLRKTLDFLMDTPAKTSLNDGTARRRA
jgi:hypothetical protein